MKKMTVTQLIMPKLGMTMEKGKIIKWLKKEGDPVKRGEEILELETDKVTLKIEAPGSGVLRKIIAPEKAVIPIGRTIAIIADPDEKVDIDAIIAKEVPIEVAVKGPVPTIAPQIERPAGRIFASPRARALAKEKNVDLKFMLGTGPDGRIVEQDVVNYVQHPVNLTKSGVRIRETQPIEGIRKVIAERMLSSLQNAAQLTITMDSDTTELERFRSVVLPFTEKEANLRVSFTEILVKVVAKVLEEFPIVNAVIEDNQIKYLEEINVGIAVASDKGLIVPVVHQANKKSLIEIAKISKELIVKTRTGKLTLDDLSRGTFTITNLGMFGVEIFTPILNKPEVGILGVGKMEKKWIVKKDQPTITPTMQLSFSFDHQIIDGHIAAQFLGRIKEIIESYKQLETICAIDIKKKVFVEEYPSDKIDADVIVIGGGPGGYSAAIRAAQLGLKVILLEQSKIGGVCVNEGCIPTKSIMETVNLLILLRNAKEREFGLQFDEVKADFKRIFERKDEIVKMISDGIQRNLEQLSIQIIKEPATVLNPRLIEIQSTTKKQLKCKRIILATGSKFKQLAFDKNLYIANNQVLTLTQLPKSMVILGINVPSLEYAIIFQELGVAVKIIAENLAQLNHFDQDIIHLLPEILDAKGIEFEIVEKIVDLKKEGDQKAIYFQKEGKSVKLQTDLVINLVERTPNSENLVSPSLNLATENGRILTDEYLETNISGLFAVGDVQNQIYLSHTAMYEGSLAAENLFEKKFKVNYNAVPFSLLTTPEIASVGLTEQQARASGMPIKVEKRAFGYSAKARISGEPEGFIKIIIDETNRIQGIHIIGSKASELIASGVLAIGRNIMDLALNFNFHPTLAELINECAWQFQVNSKK
jgi:pyruvate dehydrogenase E2 component (dihydrolipoamide acetyltransferase)